MMNKNILQLLIAAFFLLKNNCVISQEEYFTQVNPTTCTFSILDSIPTIKWISVGSSTFDKINKRYIFHGMDNAYNNYLCSVDATNGNTISLPLMLDNFACLKVDNSNGVLYGLHWTSALSNTDFVSINPSNLTYTIIHHINLTSLGGDVTFDDANHKYIFAGGDSLGTTCLYTLDALTGNTISKPALTNAHGILYDNISGNTYALQWNNNLQVEEFVTINPTNGNVSIINSIPNLVGTNMGYETFDEINKRYTFLGVDNNSTRLFTLDASNGQIVSNPLYPTFTSPYNLIETEYDNSTGNLYALHWGPSDHVITGINNYSGKTDINIYPNPANNYFTIQTNNKTEVLIEIYDSTGKLVSKNKSANNNQNINISNLDNDVYTLKITNCNYTTAKKLIVIH